MSFEMSTVCKAPLDMELLIRTAEISQARLEYLDLSQLRLQRQ